MSKNELELFLYKNKLNESTLIDILDCLSSKSITYLLRDLSVKKEISKEIGKNDTLYIFTDGACRNNGKKNAKGGYGVYFTDDMECPFYKLNCVKALGEEPTNQKAELLGINKAFRLINDNIELFNKETKKVVVVSDSMYSIKCINEWSKNWVKNNWKTSKGEAVKNDIIIKDTLEKYELLKSRNLYIELKHTFSHTVRPNNKDTLEYILWYGNDKIDKMINSLLDEMN